MTVLRPGAVRVATIDRGVQLHQLGNTGLAERDQFVRQFLTAKGAAIYLAIPEAMSGRLLRGRVSQAVDAGY